MNPYLEKLKPYPFERLATLLDGVEPFLLPPIAFSIGEPKQPTPAFIREALLEHLHELAIYPSTRGKLELREAIGHWLERRFQLPPGRLDPKQHILPVNGTREALFAVAQSMLQSGDIVLIPNPFYQIYEGAALLAGAEPVYLDCTPENGFLPDLDIIDEITWKRCQLMYLCTPGNPTGAVASEEWLATLIELAQRHDFIIACDECYADIYLDEAKPPAGLLGACERMGHRDFKNCMVFHSLSKRSNAPGLRSGFVAGDAHLIQAFFRYRIYHGCAMPPHTQSASIKAWDDDVHALTNREAYRQKFAAVLDILGPVLDVQPPAGGFYLWAKTPIDDTEFTRSLYARQNVTVLPGQYLSRRHAGHDPGKDRIRIALVATQDECIEGAHRIHQFLKSL